MNKVIFAALLALAGGSLVASDVAEARCWGANGYCTRRARRAREAAAAERAREAEKYNAWYATLAPLPKAQEDLRVSKAQAVAFEQTVIYLRDEIKQEDDKHKEEIRQKDDEIGGLQGWLIFLLIVIGMLGFIVFALALRPEQRSALP